MKLCIWCLPAKHTFPEALIIVRYLICWYRLYCYGQYMHIHTSIVNCIMECEHIFECCHFWKNIWIQFSIVFQKVYYDNISLITSLACPELYTHVHPNYLSIIQEITSEIHISLTACLKRLSLHDQHSNRKPLIQVRVFPLIP